MRTSLSVLAAVLAAFPPRAAAQQLSEDTFETLRDAIVPKAGEVRWREIPWRPSLWDALREARAKDAPVLLWAMNGHPLGCT